MLMYNFGVCAIGQHRNWLRVSCAGKLGCVIAVWIVCVYIIVYISLVFACYALAGQLLPC